MSAQSCTFKLLYTAPAHQHKYIAHQVIYVQFMKFMQKNIQHTLLYAGLEAQTRLMANYKQKYVRWREHKGSITAKAQRVLFCVLVGLSTVSTRESDDE